MPEPTGREGAIEAAMQAIHDGRCRDKVTHADYEGCVRFYADHAELAVDALLASGHLHLAGESCVPREQLRQVGWGEVQGWARRRDDRMPHDLTPFYVQHESE